MGKEIERKFLIKQDVWEAIDKPKPTPIKQCYLLTDPEKTIRIRTKGDKGFLTIKGKNKGIIRTEFEYKIPIGEAIELITLYGEQSIEKVRYNIKYKDHTWEVDVFEQANQGLIVAEIELQNEEESFEKPEWIDKEVSHDIKYYNSNLIQHPYSKW